MLDQPPPDLPQDTGMIATPEDKNLGMLCHLTALIGVLIGGGFLGFVGPLIIMNLQQGKTPFVTFHAREILNHQITFMLVYVFCFLLIFVGSFLFCIGILFIFPLVIAAILSIVFEIMASVQASRGEWTRIPWSIRFIS
jgi:uncharacterized Tic20 family protein